MEQFIFIILFIITIGSACVVAFGKNLIYSAFSLLGTFLGVAGIFVLLEADFLALVQIVVYAGGILVLTLFAVMLTSKIESKKETNPQINFKIAIPLFLGFLGISLYIVFTGNWELSTVPHMAESSVETIGNLLLSKYLLPFEVVSVVMIVAMIGAAIITRRHVK